MGDRPVLIGQEATTIRLPRRESRRRLYAVISVISAMLGALRPGVAFSSIEQLPNLTALPAPYVTIALTTTTIDPVGIVYGPSTPPAQLRFTTKAANTGEFALDVFGRPTTDPLALEAEQCVRWDLHVCDERRSVGALRWHEEHRHWHFEGFELYELRTLLSDGTPDFGIDGLVTASRKASFCLEDSESDDPDALPLGFYQGCTSALQGISPGWSDIYDSSVPGQELSLDGVVDGLYALVITVDPDGRLAETDESDNRAWSTIEIFENGTQARTVTPS